MLLINKSARLIDFSFDKQKFRLMPAGSAVEVPQKAMESAFLKSMIAEKSIEVTTQAPEQHKVETKVEKNEPVKVKKGK